MFLWCVFVRECTDTNSHIRQKLCSMWTAHHKMQTTFSPSRHGARKHVSLCQYVHSTREIISYAHVSRSRCLSNRRFTWKSFIWCLLDRASLW